LAPDPNDKLRIIMNDLGKAPQEVAKDEDTYIHLPLFSRFQASLQDVEALGATEQLFNNTKYLLLSVLRETPNIPPTTSLTEVINFAKQYAMEIENNPLLDQINKLLQNLMELEEKGFVSKVDNYSRLVKSMAEDVNTRTTLRRTMENQKNSIEAVLKEIQVHQSYLQGQIAQYREYLQNCRKNSVTPLKLKRRYTKASISKKKGHIVGPVKYTYAQLEKDGLIIDSEIPKDKRMRMNFVFTSTAVGLIDVSCNIMGITVTAYQIDIEDLLEKQHNNIRDFKLDDVKLDVNMLLYFSNRLLNRGY